jgi:hypothetical protein
MPNDEYRMTKLVNGEWRMANADVPAGSALGIEHLALTPALFNYLSGQLSHRERAAGVVGVDALSDRAGAAGASPYRSVRRR